MRFLVFIALLGFVLADEVPTEENVLVLSKSNFESVITSTSNILVEFCKFSYYIVFSFLTMSLANF